MDLYDEFGNYIGQELDSDSDGIFDSEDDAQIKKPHLDEEILPEPSGLAQIEDDEDDIYKGAKVVIQEEDMQPLEVPIIAPVEKEAVRLKDVKKLDSDYNARNFNIKEDIRESDEDIEFFLCLTKQPEYIRNICIAGDFHHGKTTLMDLFLEKSLIYSGQSNDFPERYMDSRLDERTREMSIKANPISLLFSNDLYEGLDCVGCDEAVWKHKTFIFNMFDCPGHINFFDEFAHAATICDVTILVIDVLMGCNSTCENIIKLCLYDNIKFVVVINCIDRLIMELRLPPADAYHKINHVINQVNTYAGNLASTLGLQVDTYSPINGNVAFASGQFGIFFTLKSFSVLYSDALNSGLGVEKFYKKLWGNSYYNRETFKFTSCGKVEEQRSFVEFVLTPLYKLFGIVSGKEPELVNNILNDRFGIHLNELEMGANTRNLLRTTFTKLFHNASGFVDFVLNQSIPSSFNAINKIQSLYTGDLTTQFASDMLLGDPNGPLVIHIVKNYHDDNCKSFSLFGRIYSGTITVGQEIRILGNTFSLNDDEDMVVRTVASLAIPKGRYNISVQSLSAGNWVLISGIDLCLFKTCTITNSVECEIFKPLSQRFKYLPCMLAVCKIACEPLVPSELPKMVKGLRSIEKIYPSSKIKVEESGEHVVVGTGELYLDCIFHDLRKLYGDLEIKVSDPVVIFTETIVETSAIKCCGETPNGKNKIYSVAEPLEKGLCDAIEKGMVRIGSPFFEQQLLDIYQWDRLAAKNVWAFGPDAQGPNILLNDILPSANLTLCDSLRDSIIQGFQWATREGPLIEEPLRNVKFKLLDLSIANDFIDYGAGQIIPTAR